MHKRELHFYLRRNPYIILFKISASGLFLDYSFNFANFILDILIKYILIKKRTSFSYIIIIIIVIIIIIIIIIIIFQNVEGISPNGTQRF